MDKTIVAEKHSVIVKMSRKCLQQVNVKEHYKILRERIV